MEVSLDPTWTVARLLSTFPQTAKVFIALKTGCVGCPLGKFCTLKEVADAYDLPPEMLIERLGETLQQVAECATENTQMRSKI